MAWLKTMSRISRRMFGGTPVYDGVGGGRRALAWMPGNPGAVAALSLAQDELCAKSRDLVRRNAWAAAGIEAFVANAIGTGIKPQSMVQDKTIREAIHSLWWDWCDQADAAGLTDFYGLQALATRAMLEGGEALIRLRYRRAEDGLPVALQIQVLEAEHLPTTLNRDLPDGNVIRAGIEFDRLGRRMAYHLYRSHPNDGLLAPMSSQGGMDTVRVDANEVIHLFRPLRPGQICGEPWLTRALVKLNELDQYDDAELVRKKTAAMFAGFITRLSPEDNLMGEGLPDASGAGLAGLEPGTMQILEPGEDVKFSQPADVGASYAEFLRMQFRAVAAAMGITYEMLTGDLTQVNYSSIRAGLLEFRRRREAIQHGVIVHPC
jgi:lambda family phage portal protein